MKTHAPAEAMDVSELLGQAVAAAEPSEGALDDPAAR